MSEHDVPFKDFCFRQRPRRSPSAFAGTINTDENRIRHTLRYRTRWPHLLGIRASGPTEPNAYRFAGACLVWTSDCSTNASSTGQSRPYSHALVESDSG